MLTAVLGLAYVAVLIWVLQKRMSLALGLYFAAQLLAAVFGFGVHWIAGDNSRVYLYVYTGFTALILLTVWNLIRFHLQDRKYRNWIPGLAALPVIPFAKLTYMEIEKPLTIVQWIIFSEGCLLVLAAVLIGALAAHTDRKAVAFILSVLWFSQALFDFGYLMAYPAWHEASWIVSPITCIVAWTGIGWCLGGRYRIRRTV